MKLKHLTLILLPFCVLLLLLWVWSPFKLRVEGADWVLSWTSYVKPVGIVLDSNQHIYICGGFKGNVDLNPGLAVYKATASPDISSFLIKLDTKGAFQWASTEDNIILADIAIDDFDNIYVSGNHMFHEDQQLSPTGDVQSCTRFGNGYLAKIDPTGIQLWAIIWGGEGFADGNSIAIDNTGNIYVTGSYQRTVDFDPGQGCFELNANNSSNAYLSCFNSDGSLKWVRTYGNDNTNDSGYSIDTDFNGNIYLLGETIEFSGLKLEGVDNLSQYPSDRIAFLNKYNSNGDLQWTQQFGRSQSLYWRPKVYVDDLANIYTVGGFAGQVDFAPTSNNKDNHFVSTGLMDVYLNRFNYQGELQLTQTWGGPGEDYANAIIVDKESNIIVCGGFNSGNTLGTNRGIPNLYRQEVFVYKLDSSGTIVTRWGSPKLSTGRDIAIDESGSIYLTGWLTDGFYVIKLSVE